LFGERFENFENAGQKFIVVRHGTIRTRIQFTTDSLGLRQTAKAARFASPELYLELSGGATVPAMRICLANVIFTRMTQISLATE
jgi:hypothetical protein